MAEYIDRDIAIRTAIEMCVKVVGHGITQFDAAEIANAFEDIPTADVVPKSELEKALLDVEVLGAELSRYTENLMQMREQDKRNIAREIFGEIEELSHRFMNDEHYIFGDMVWDIAELKKKYLGEIE